MRLPRPHATLRRLRAAGAWLLVLLAWAAVLPGFLPEPAAAGSPAAAALAAGDGGAPAAGQDAAGDHRAWLDGRQAAPGAAAERAAAEGVARGPGVTPTTQGVWVVPAGADTTVPPLALSAYRNGASWAAGFDSSCRLSWSVLAGIGRMESNHGRTAGAAARFSPSGDVAPPILGPVLDGQGGFAAIPDTDAGRLDGDPAWDRAVGPMQFLPSTWRSLGRDGNRDGTANPENLFDAAVSAAGYLCLSGGDLADPAGLRQAVYAYNHSWPYVDAVLGWATLYEQRLGGGPGVLPPLPPTTTVAPTTTLAPTTTVGPTTTVAPTTTLAPTTTSPPTTAPGTTTTTGPATSTTGATTTTTPCTPPTSTTRAPGSTTTTTTTTTLPPGSSTTTTTTLPPCRSSTTTTRR